MSWTALIECLERRLGPKVAALVDEAAREESRKPITPELAHEVAPHEPTKAARLLDVHRTTIYRLLRSRRSLIR
ncbi:MAG: hypothetical protein MUE59_16560 [Thiobacillaceae bacterium]|nr:hypothetical protein [Thiobacillaceae bacterium]